jgi:uncharacterized protein
MRSGADVIAQATLASGRWLGRADVLLRVERKSKLGAWSYEALDTKLAQETKAGAVLQLCLYSDLIREVQGELPEYMYVVPRKPEFPLEPYRVEDYLAYYRLVRRRLEAAVDAPDGGGATLHTYPEPVAHCDVCRWWPRCDTERRKDDHLSLVAGISRLQTRELQSRAIATRARLAIEPLPIAWKPARGAKDGYGRCARAGAHSSRGPGQGSRPPRAAADRAGPRVGTAPRAVAGRRVPRSRSRPVRGRRRARVPVRLGEGRRRAPGNAGARDRAAGLRPRWALDRAAERTGFEATVDRIMGQWEADPNMHVYHFGAYEPGALKRLMGRHASREAQIDRLLRGGRIVDLHTIVKQALRASVEEYSIKKLEPLYDFEREQPLEGRAGRAARDRAQPGAGLPGERGRRCSEGRREVQPRRLPLGARAARLARAPARRRDRARRGHPAARADPGRSQRADRRARAPRRGAGGAPARGRARGPRGAQR